MPCLKIRFEAKMSFMEALVPGYGVRRLERSHLSAPVKLVPRKTAASVNFEMLDGDGDFDCYPGLFPMASVLGRHLTSFRIRTEMHARRQTVFDVPAILLACSHLQHLQLRGIRVRDLDCFVDAYETGDCKVQVLSLRSIELQSTSGVTRFLKALEDPQHLMTRRLMELELDASCLIQSGSGLESLMTILDRNRTLRVLFVRANTCQRDQVSQVLSDCLSLSVYIRRSPMDMRSKLAFLSALNKRSGSLCAAVDHMDSGICSLIFAFAAPVIRRLVRVVDE